MKISGIDITIRVVSVVLAVALTTMLSVEGLYIASLVLGMGHILLAYVYQIEGKHLGWGKFFILLVIFVIVCLIGFHTSYALFTAAIGVGFVIHFSMDEVRLLARKHNLFTTLEILPLVLVYGSAILDTFFGSHVFWWGLGLSGLVVVAYAILSLLYKRAPNALSAVFASYFLVALLIYGFAHGVAPGRAFQWFIGLGFVHYFIWYAMYWFKLRHQPVQQTKYGMRVALICGMLAVAVFAWIGGPVPILAVLFSPIMFDVWVTMHGASTIRFSEYVAAFKLTS